eukprot:4265973-Amphidinium_carterae.1
MLLSRRQCREPLTYFQRDGATHQPTSWQELIFQTSCWMMRQPPSIFQVYAKTSRLPGLTQFFNDAVIQRREEWTLSFKLPDEVDPDAQARICDMKSFKQFVEQGEQLSLKDLQNPQQHTVKYEIRDSRQKKIKCAGRLDALLMPGALAYDKTLTEEELFKRTCLYVEVESEGKGDAAVTQCLMCLALLAHRYDIPRLIGLVVDPQYRFAQLVLYTKSAFCGSYYVDGCFALHHIHTVAAQLTSVSSLHAGAETSIEAENVEAKRRRVA